LSDKSPFLKTKASETAPASQIIKPRPIPMKIIFLGIVLLLYALLPHLQLPENDVWSFVRLKRTWT